MIIHSQKPFGHFNELIMIMADFSNFAESCSGLHKSWSNIITETRFPVPPGTEITLGCETGYSLSGDSIVTCLKDNDFQHSSVPVCTRGWSLLLIWLIWVFFSFDRIWFFNSLPGPWYPARTNWCISDECTSLPEVKNLFSSTEFPIPSATVVTVYCDDAYYLEGDEIITCKEDADFVFSSRPDCKPSKIFSVSLILSEIESLQFFTRQKLPGKIGK